ncbi:MAG: antibiotic biosynthesis monooxygenase [Acidimicrobiales bacterium]
MSVVRINAITVPAERADELAARFAARAGEVGKADGFEEFQLLRPTDDRETWLVYTRWRDEGAFTAWMDSRAFTAGHAGGGEGGPGRGGRGVEGEGRPPGGEGRPPGGPVATGSELWSYAVEQREVG